MGLMDVVKGAGNILTGGFSGLAETVVNTVAGQFPEKMSESEKKQLEVEIQKLVHQREIETMKAWNEQESNFQNFTKEMEGSVSDLKAIPIIGSIIIFLRGAFRPLMAYGVLYTDIMVFSGSWNIQLMTGVIAPQVMSLLWVVNLIVLTFYFGERAIKNLSPIIEKMFMGNK